MPRTVLALVPHPDDAEFSAGGTLAKMAAEGARVIIVVATDGRCGSFTIGPEALPAIRAEEARRGAAALGAEPPIFLGHPDLELDKVPPGVLREQVVRAIRQHRPDVIVAEDPFAPFEVHPDHRAMAWAVSDAVSFAPLPSMHPEHLQQGLEPHFVVEKYLYTEHVPSTNRVVDISDTFAAKAAAMAEHKSQVEFLVEDVMRQARLAGLDLRALLGEAASGPMAALTWALEAQASETGSRAGVRYGEAFRYVRFHPFVEGLLGALPS